MQKELFSLLYKPIYPYYKHLRKGNQVNEILIFQWRTTLMTCPTCSTSRNSFPIPTTTLKTRKSLNFSWTCGPTLPLLGQFSFLFTKTFSISEILI
jgi:hypothetical protein